MELFQQIPDEDEQMPRDQALAGVVVAAVAGSELLTNDEVDALAGQLSRLPAFRGASRNAVRRSLETAYGLGLEAGGQALLDQATASVPEDLQATAFAIVCDLLFAEHGPSQDLAETLERVRTGLAVPEEEALGIIEVLELKNRA